MPATKATRKRAPSEEEWERIKPELKRLFIDENLPLKEAARIMASQHSFHASIDMYKLRLKKWRLQKNFKKIELAAAADAVRPFCRSGIATPCLTVDQRSIPIDRVRRHFGEDLRSPRKPYASGSIQLGSSTSAYTRTLGKTLQGRRMTIPRVLLQVSPVMSLFERTAYQIHAYYSWKLTEEDNWSSGSGSMTTSIELYNVALDVTKALEVGNVHLVQAALRNLTMSTKEVVVAQHPDLLQVLLRMCSRTVEDQFYGPCWNACLAYIYATAKKSLSKKNPLLMLLELRLNHFEINIHYTRLLKLAREVELQKYRQTSRFVFQTDTAMMLGIKREQGPEAASRFCNDRRNSFKEILGRDHWLSRSWSRMMAEMCFSAGLLKEAKEICLQLVDGEITPGTVGAYVCSSAMRLLAYIFESEQDYRAGAIWFRHASSAFEDLYGFGNIDAQLLLYHAKRMEAKLQYFPDYLEQQDFELERRRSEQVSSAVAELGKEMSRICLETYYDDEDDDDGDATSEGQTWNENASGNGDDSTNGPEGPVDSASDMGDIGDAEVDGSISANNKQHVFPDHMSSLETLQMRLGPHNDVQGAAEAARLPLSHSAIESTCCPEDIWIAPAPDMTVSHLGDTYSGFCLNTQPHLSALEEQLVEGEPGSRPATDSQYALDPIDCELPFVGDCADFDDLCSMPCFDNQFDFMPSFTDFYKIDLLDGNPTEVNQMVSTIAAAQHNVEGLPGLSHDVDCDLGWPNKDLATDGHVDSDLAIPVSFKDTTVMELVNWE
ncbi:hypothetical protein PV08_06389 [Exophiala spinifera]|uniref:Clr5 domain-containing protein n=1 Tax=Exophiala spinifera TaxID=91928 RepID=A0A0D2BBF1_9EURO|nr:uncharacterized protein PV08_06389 [Exophiala spinifera]KIW16338.1 hypothetical protein PV08_06389 [Exophiala spinifera]